MGKTSVKAYKVVRVNSKGELESVIIHGGKYKITYTPGVPSVGIDGTPIFAFLSEGMALAFSPYEALDRGRESVTEQIWICEGEEVPIPNEVVTIYNYDFDDIYDKLLDGFWKDNRVEHSTVVWGGSIGLKTCTLLRRVR